MSDNELRSYSCAYQQLIYKGLGAKYERRAGGFELAVRVKRGEVLGSKSIISVKRLLSKALVHLSLQPGYSFSSQILAVWQQKIIAADSLRDLGLFCEHLARLLFGPDPDRQADKDES